MKIAQVLFSGLGGHGSVAFSLVRADRARAHTHSLLFYGIEPLAPGYAAACQELGVKHTTVRKRSGLDLASWAEVTRHLARFSPDVVVLHSMSLILAGAFRARLSKVPIIAVDHLSNQVKKRRDWTFAALALLLADRLVVLTSEFAAELKARFGPLHRDGRIVVIGNGIDVAAYAPRPVGLPPTRESQPVLTVGMHGRFSPSKDHATLLRAIANLRDGESSGRRPPLHLLLAGDGETLAASQDLAKGLGVADRVRFLGMMPETDLPGYLRSLDLYVQSSHGETMSTAVMQAMASGLPVLASDVAGLRNMVGSGKNGLLFPSGDHRVLSRLLERLATDATERARLGAAAREHACANWSHETMFARYLDLMQGLVR